MPDWWSYIYSGDSSDIPFQFKFIAASFWCLDKNSLITNQLSDFSVNMAWFLTLYELVSIRLYLHNEVFRHYHPHNRRYRYIFC